MTSNNHLRYKAIRERLIILHRILTKRAYPVHVYPSHLMTTEQLRDRESYQLEDTIPDRDFYERPTPRSMKVVDIVEILQNVNAELPLAFSNPHKNIIEIYENIQEYGSLWVELKNQVSGYCVIDPEEIRKLEGLSFYLYDQYRQIKTYLMNRELRTTYGRYKDDPKTLLDYVGILGLPSASHGKKSIVPDHVSYYDLLVAHYQPNVYQSPEIYYQPSEDSLFKREQAQEKYGIWGTK